MRLSRSLTTKLHFPLIKFGQLFLSSLSRTLSWEVVGPEPEELTPFLSKRCIFCFWHSDQLIMAQGFGQMARYVSDKNGTFGLSPLKLQVLISQHNDGQIIADIINGFGIGAIRGSSSKGGVGALKELTKVQRKGYHVVITPDGPRGPKHQAKAGPILLSKQWQVPIIPLALHFSKRKVFRSWDSMFLPMPFSKARLVIGEPLLVPKDTPRSAYEEWRELLGQGINKLQAYSFEEKPKVK